MARSIGNRIGQLAALAALLVACIALLGCGGSDDDTTTSDGGDDAFAPNVVTDDDVAAQEEGSPGRALLEWWQAVQFQDAATAVSLTSQKTLDELNEKDFEELVTTRGQGLQGIEVLETSESGDTASVRSGLLTFTPEKPGEPPPDEPTASRPATFEMEEDGGDWLFAEPAFLAPMIDAMKAAEKESGSSDEDSSDGGSG